MLLIAFLLPTLTGLVIFTFLDKRLVIEQKYRSLFMIFAFLLGFFFPQFLFLIWLLVFKSGDNYPILEIVLNGLCLCQLYFFSRVKPENFQGFRIFSIEKPNQIIYSLFFFFFLLSFLLLSVNYSRSYPHGSSDGWTIWNTKARFLYRGQNNWQNVFKKELNLSHPDYPLLLPLSIARGWTLIGEDTVLYPIAVSISLSTATVMLLFFSVSIMSNEIQGFVSALFLMATPLFLTQGASQGADIPLGLLMLVAVILMSIKIKSELTGVFLGLLIWMKNEGLLFAVLFILMNFLFNRKIIKHLLIGFIPFIVSYIIFKFMYVKTETNDFNFALQYMMKNVQNISRLRLVFHVFKFQILRFGNWEIQPWLLILMYMLISVIQKRKVNKNVIAPFFVIISMVLSYALLFVLASTLDLSWHINNSLNRLLLQLWPSFIFILFLCFKKEKSKL